MIKIRTKKVLEIENKSGMIKKSEMKKDKNFIVDFPTNTDNINSQPYDTNKQNSKKENNIDILSH